MCDPKWSLEDTLSTPMNLVEQFRYGEFILGFYILNYTNSLPHGELPTNVTNN
jgi:hypothetical protein